MRDGTHLREVIVSSFPLASLKLLALDEEDLKVMSVHLQDAVIRASDMAYLPNEQRFAAVLNRFDWITAEANGGKALQRCQCALRLERVQRAQVHGIHPAPNSGVFELLAVTFEGTEPPAGHIIFHFSGGGAIRLHVECIEAELKDLGAVWQTSCMPKHDVVDVGEGEETQLDKAV